MEEKYRLQGGFFGSAAFLKEMKQLLHIIPPTCFKFRIDFYIISFKLRNGTECLLNPGK